MATISPDAQAVITQAGEGALAYVQSQPGYNSVGGKLTSGEATSLLSGFQAKPSVGTQVQQGIAGLTSQQYQFDPNQYLPQIQSTADSIYTPQQAQLEAIRQLQTLQYQDTKVSTEKDFEKRMQQEVEAMNRRGAGFSGGAILNEQDIRSSQESALNQLGIQYMAGQYSSFAQQAMLAAEKTQFIQDRLYNAESSAYARWSNDRNFSLQALQTQYQVYANERDFARSVFESDRAFEQNEKQFQQQYKISEEQFKMAKEEFNIDMKIKGLSYESALDNFKNKYAETNTGLFGLTEGGDDMLDFVAKIYEAMGGSAKEGATTTTPTASVNIEDFSGIPGLTFEK